MLKVLDIKPTEKKLTIRLSTNLMAICPVDNNPDFYSLEISFIPNKHTLDVISLRHYLLNYCLKKVLAEDLAIDLIDILVNELNPKMLSVKLTNNAEGIEIEAIEEIF